MMNETQFWHSRINALQTLSQDISSEIDMQSEILVLKENAFEAAINRWRACHAELIKAEQTLQRLLICCDGPVQSEDCMARLESALRSWPGWWKHVLRKMNWLRKMIVIHRAAAFCRQTSEFDEAAPTVLNWKRLRTEFAAAMSSSPWAVSRQSSAQRRHRVWELTLAEEQLTAADARSMRENAMQIVASKKTAASNARAELGVARAEMRDQQCLHADRVRQLAECESDCVREISRCRQKIIYLAASTTSDSVPPTERTCNSANLTPDTSSSFDLTGSHTDLMRQSV